MSADQAKAEPETLIQRVQRVIDGTDWTEWTTIHVSILKDVLSELDRLDSRSERYARGANTVIKYLAGQYAEARAEVEGFALQIERDHAKARAAAIHRTLMEAIDSAADPNTGASGLQDRVVAWHRSRFPEATLERQLMKLASEVGEAHDAYIGTFPDEPKDFTLDDVLDECADVVICAMAIAGRCGGDLLLAVERKLAILTDPNSGHRSALIGNPNYPQGSAES